MSRDPWKDAREIQVHGGGGVQAFEEPSPLIQGPASQGLQDDSLRVRSKAVENTFSPAS